MKEFIEYLVKNLVDNPSGVFVQCSQIGHQVLADVEVAPEDIAKLIGRDGRIIRSVKTISSSVAARSGCRLRVRIID